MTTAGSRIHRCVAGLVQEEVLAGHDRNRSLPSASTDADPDAGRPVVLVGVDESPASRAAMKWAVEHACATRAQIRAVAVWHLPPQLGDVPVLPCEQLQEEAQAWLREAIPPDCSVPVHTEVVRGDPTAVLLEHAQRAR